MPNRALTFRCSVLLLAGTLVASCSSDDDTSPVATASTTGSSAGIDETVTTEAPSTAPVAADSTSVAAQAETMRGQRYCEVLLVTPRDAGFTARVFNTFTLNDCPPDQWAALDVGAIASANGVPVALLNGPRYWLMDSVSKTREGELNVVDFGGGLTMNELAVVTVTQRLGALRPYVASSVERKTVFTFDAGNTVYELTDNTGATYVMQSWSQQVEPTLSEADLPGLAARLTLPDGWTYSSRVLTEPLALATVDVPAQVLQDDLRNSYSLETVG